MNRGRDGPPPCSYEALRRQAEDRGDSLEDFLREAAETYVREHKRGDPLDAFVGGGDLDDGTWSERDDWRTTDR